MAVTKLDTDSLHQLNDFVTLLESLESCAYELYALCKSKERMINDANEEHKDLFDEDIKNEEKKIVNLIIDSFIQ